MLPERGMKRWLTMLALVLGGFTVLAVVSSYVLRHQILTHIVQSKGYQVVDNPNGSWRLQVPPAKVPQTPQVAQSTAPIDDLPAHWEEGAKAKPGAPDASYVPPEAKAAIAKAVRGFLPLWESFPAGADAQQHAAWERRVKPYVDDALASGVLERTESYQPSAICPGPPCVVGSAWYTFYPSQGPVTVQAYTSDQAFVTVYGLVRYLNPGGRLAGTVVLRDYGLTLVRAGSRWLVTRAVADTVTTGS